MAMHKNKRMNKTVEPDCNTLLDVFYKCMTTQDSYIKNECNKMEKLLNLNTTFLGMYIQCRKNEAASAAQNVIHYEK